MLHQLFKRGSRFRVTRIRSNHRALSERPARRKHLGCAVPQVTKVGGAARQTRTSKHVQLVVCTRGRPTGRCAASRFAFLSSSPRPEPWTLGTTHCAFSTPRHRRHVVGLVACGGTAERKHVPRLRRAQSDGEAGALHLPPTVAAGKSDRRSLGAGEAASEMQAPTTTFSHQRCVPE